MHRHLFVKRARKIATGRIQLTVGYLEFDEDGGAANGIEDNIEYDYYEITKKIDDYIIEQTQKVELEAKIVGIIEAALNSVVDKK